MNLWHKYKLKRRLRKMERVLCISLNEEQKKFVLDPDPPNVLAGWCRRSGKTTCACLHLLLHAPVNDHYSSVEAMELLKDPDKNLGRLVSSWTYSYLYDMRTKLRRAGINTCVLLQPMPSMPAGRVGHGRFVVFEKDERR